MTRLTVLQTISEVIDTKCKGCPNRPDRTSSEYSAKDRHCLQVCPVGKQLQELGTMLIIKRKEQPKKVVGVSWIGAKKKWRVTVKGKFVGYFATEQEAIKQLQTMGHG